MRLTMELRTDVGKKRLKLKGDGMQVVLSEIGMSEKTGSVYDMPIGYFPNLEQALGRLAEEALGQEDMVSIKALNRRIDELHEVIKGIYRKTLKKALEDAAIAASQQGTGRGAAKEINRKFRLGLDEKQFDQTKTSLATWKKPAKKGKK